ncbi:integrase core domain-containing protein [Gallaecimonas kandeliae]|uniref:integrase core domain-containing protein n=1 Tax=Gallaecimonas kandeliae TaxID=3029055 RepID=UPI0026485F15|nr:integrase core domain-containing protein [Gallaecimonas kandeliae]WKE66662.1 integrase core domain-containing protein [Gallaecimonas kandeliae]
MPAYKTGKRTQQYSLEFKKKAVLWSHEPHRSVKEVAEALDIPTFMYGIHHSMDRTGQCTDNAEVESFFKTLKAELIHDSQFSTIDLLRQQVGHYIQHF